MKRRIVRKNKKRIDPRYFLYEYLESDEELEKEAAMEERPPEEEAVMEEGLPEEEEYVPEEEPTGPIEKR